MHHKLSDTAPPKVNEVELRGTDHGCSNQDPHYGDLSNNEASLPKSFWEPPIIALFPGLREGNATLSQQTRLL